MTRPPSPRRLAVVAMVVLMPLVAAAMPVPSSAGPLQGGSKEAPGQPAGPFLSTTFLGGDGEDWLHALALGDDGSVYVTGYTTSTDMPTIDGAIQRVRGGRFDVYVAKLSPDLGTLVWSTLLGGSGDDVPWDIALGRDGSVYVTGSTRSPDFPTTPQAYSTDLYGSSDAFLARIEDNGTSLAFSTLLGGEGEEEGRSLVPLPDGSVYVTGRTESTFFPTTAGVLDRSLGGFSDVFVATLSADGRSLSASTFLGGDYTEKEPELAVDGGGDVWVAGSTTSLDFPTTPGAYDREAKTGLDAFVAELDAGLTRVKRATLLGGVANDVVRSIVHLGADGVAICGFTNSPSFPTTANAIHRVPAGETDGFIAIFDGDLSILEYGTLLGGGAFDVARAIAVDGAGLLRVAGYTNSTDFPTTEDAYDDLKTMDDHDLFYMELDPTGAQGNYSTFIGVDGSGDYGMDMALDPLGVPVIGGYTHSEDFPMVAEPLDPTFNGVGDALVIRYTRDLGPPAIFNDTTPGEATTGGDLEFSVEVEDPSGVAVVSVELSVDGGEANLTDMTGDGTRYSLVLKVPETARNLSYRFVARDALGRENSTEVAQVAVIDGTRPYLVEDLSALAATTGDPFHVLFVLGDNRGIYRADLEYGNYLSPSIITMNRNASVDGAWEAWLPIGPSEWGKTEYRVVFEDVSYNVNWTGWSDLPILDDDPPFLYNLSAPEEALPGATINLSVEAVDNILVDRVTLTVAMGSAVPYEVTVGPPAGRTYWYELELEPGNVGSLQVTFAAFDLSGNVARMWATIQVRDDEPPWIEIEEMYQLVGTGESYNVTFSASDGTEVEAMYVWYGFGDEATQYWTSPTVPTARFTVVTPTDSIGPVSIRLGARDVHGNVNETPLLSSFVHDVIPPVADAGADLEAEDGLVNLDGSASTDNIGIFAYVWTYWLTDEGRQVRRNTSHPSLEEFLPPGTYEVTLTVMDAAGHTDSDTVVVTVAEGDSDDGYISDTTFLALLLLLTLAGAVLIWFFGMRRGGGPDAFEEGL